jgi:hypothetical protein
MPVTPRRPAIAAIVLVTLLAACSAPSPSSSPSPTAITPVPSAGASPSAEPTPTPLATPTPAPPLSLTLPPHRDVRHVRFSVSAKVPDDGNGTITVKVTNLSSERVAEIVLRWPTDLDQVLYLAPFTPSARRLTGFLVQPWTKWVIGPGEMGEPAGTTSLGWGPLDPGATLMIPLVVTRRQPGAVAFDLQFLAGEALLTSESGGPATTRVSVP